MAHENNYGVQSTFFQWTVKYPNILTGFDICSPIFSVDSYGNSRFYLEILAMEEEDDYTYLSIYLLKYDYRSLHPLKFNVELRVISDDDDFTVRKTVCFSTDCLFELKSFAEIKKKMEHHPKDLLTLRLQIDPIDSEDSEVDNLLDPNEEDLEILSSDLTRALRAKRFCDLKFKSNEGTYSINLHKFIVATRYPNLATTLNLREETNQEHNLGIDITAIKMLTQYLYSGCINISKATFGLHDIVKRAELDHLENILFPTPRVVHASTSVVSKSGSFTWNIPKFSSSVKRNTMLVNTLCSDLSLEWTKLRILLHISQNAEGEDWLAFKIIRTEESEQLYMLCKISLVGKKEYSKSYVHHFYKEREFIIESFVEMKSIEKKESGYLIDDTLKIYLEFSISDLREISEYDLVKCLEIKRGRFSPVARNMLALHKDFKNLYFNPSFSDFTLQVMGELLHVHKMILSARSPVFSSMFQDDTEANTTGTAVIDDFDPCIIESLLCYIYCGEIVKKTKRIKYLTDLYRASIRYEVLPLTKKCSHLIGTCLTTRNVIYVINFADEYRDKNLMESVKEFVCCHADEVFELKEWQAMMEERIDLISGIVNDALELEEEDECYTFIHFQQNLQC